MLLQLTYQATPVYSLAAQQNAYPLFSGIKLTFPETDNTDTREILRDLTVRLDCESGDMLSEEWPIAQIAQGQVVTLQDRTLRFSHSYLTNLSDEVPLRFKFTVHADATPDSALLTESETITVFPASFWGGESRQPELLAAFVKPNGVYVESLVKSVTQLLEQNGHGRSADGYQSNTREKPYLMTAALWSVVTAQKISYVSPPPSYAHQGQFIRLASEISNQKMAACLDLSVLFASCLELMGLNPVIALSEEHAFVGAWLIDTTFPLLTNDDSMEVRKRVDAGDLVFFETTMVTNTHQPTFRQACAHARNLISEEHEDTFVYVIDIAQARSRKIKAIATIEERPDESAADEEHMLTLPAAPPLPPVRATERITEETPDTRIETWQRKLLDLTKRNTLLAFKERTAGLRVFCPDIGELEDKLADGTKFSFVSSENSPVNDRERSSESFRLTTGNDLHVEYALDQLEKGKIVINMPQKKLESTSVNLLRKAKNDLAEGGANTLFIALGMLSWKEHPEDDRSYKAPLILLPVELTRRSAQAPVRLQQINEDEPIFNLTLIEFLMSEYSINLNHFREALPEDESGIDVHAIWTDVREAVSEQKGFEVLGECVVASFSFAKYLMWNDLRERIDDLKQSPFVEHLVEHPQQGYQQDSSFLDPKDLDTKIDPTKIFLPLNCDSSQLVAVEASSRPQDFVLEGPPGTGKSETIANMIANNIANGRKVLFVAEKIAALQVVYRRLKKIGLDHLALELHSNKANKKAVLEQLRQATGAYSVDSNDEWLKQAQSLGLRRQEINNLVFALHAPTRFGVSVRDAISCAVRFENEHALRFTWGANLSDCPVDDEAGFEALLELAKKTGLAFGDISSIDTHQFHQVKAMAWSFSWQEEMMHAVQASLEPIAQVEAAARALAAHFGLEGLSVSGSQLVQVKALSELVEIAESQDIAFALGNGVLEKMGRLGQLVDFKSTLDEQLESIAHGATATKLSATPVDEWISLLEEAQQSWWKKLFVKGKLNKQARAAGYEKFSEMEILYSLRDAKQIVSEIDALSGEFTDHRIWEGWDTQVDSLQTKRDVGTRVHELVKRCTILTDDLLPLLTSLKQKLVDGRDYIEGSKLASDKHMFDSAYENYALAASKLKKSSVELDSNSPLLEQNQHLQTVIANASSLKPWVDWVAVRQECERSRLDDLVNALESGTINHQDAEAQCRTAFCFWLAPRLIDANQALRTFKSSAHNARIEEFRTIDAEITKLTGGYVASQIAQRTPEIRSAEHKEHFGTLSRELQKKTRHKPIRALFEDLGERLLDLCPCLMMSPLSVAQFLPTDFNAFDVVIFDEASQMTTWDSVGAIARGKNVVVVGDPKQMPPTNFFNTTIDPDDPDEEDLESILDQALAAGLPHVRLMGHYRSRHETLIAFSNSKYYENSLVTYPSSDTKTSAVTLRRVDGIYAKGSGRNNPIEAQAVATEVVRRLRDPKLRHLSIGIVTLNSDQQKTIEDLLDDARRLQPEIEPFFQTREGYDEVFVKNLESVQGDERDVIMLSLGYGPTEPGAKTMSMNFGPLNKQGGERRLNVAITRATTEVVVFTSFDSSMIDLSRSSATAVEHLKHYLEFAERGPVALSEQSTAAYGVDQFDSDFEQAVAWALREKGWQVQTQVGVSKFRVDLGIVHPDAPGRYLAGVECDGATYHNSPSARDRDRTRHEVLENLGWNIVRLWSTDYFRDPNSSIEHIHGQLEDLLQEDRDQSEAEAEKETEASADPILELETRQTGDLFSETASNSNQSEYRSEIYFEAEHEPILKAMCREILNERPCITLKSLALEVALRHGKSKTSKKQIKHLSALINPWVGSLEDLNEPTAYWVSPEDVQEIVHWRGLNPFGYDRVWSEIAFPEARGLAREAIDNRPEDPVGYICDEFGLKRRAAVTLGVFGSWVANVKA